MNTKIIFTRNSPVRTTLINEATGKELYRIDTPRRFIGSVTRVFRCNPATPSAANPTPTAPQPQLNADEPHEPGYNSEEELRLLTGANSGNSEEEDGNATESGAEGAREDGLEEDSPLVEDEIARWYWKWFSSPRMVFEGKIRTRAEYMPLRSKIKRNYVFEHKGVSYRWMLGSMRVPKLVIDSSDTLIAQFHPNVFNKEKTCLEVTPAGMDMLDHIVVTFIPVEVERRRGGG